MFWCTAPHSDHRASLARQTLLWWKSQKGVKLHTLNPSIVGCTAGEFNRERRRWAELRASGLAYIVVDDDCLPLSGECIDAGVTALLAHPEFAILSAFPVNCNISRWTPENYESFEDLQVMEHVDVGGLRFVRKGAMTDWPEMSGPAYDRIQCDWLRKHGWRVGYAQHSRYKHLGEGASDIWNSITAEEIQRR